jgi:hypothetical protein
MLLEIEEKRGEWRLWMGYGILKTENVRQTGVARNSFLEVYDS